MTYWFQRLVPILFILFFFQTSMVSAAMEEYILVFEDEASIEMMEELPVEVVETFSLFPGAVIRADVETIDALEEWPTVISIEHNQDVAVDYSAYRNWGIDHLNIPTAWQSGYTGKGVKVAVIDSGIANHPALKIAGGVSMVDYTSSYQDDNGHGTHSAGIIAANHASSGNMGVAYGVKLYAVKSLDQQGIGKLNDTIRGIEWAVEQNMDIVNLSLGTVNSSASLKAAVDHAYNQDVLVVAAAGNKNEDTSVEKPVEYPAKYGSVIAVSAIDERNRIARFSATGPEIEFTAPGVSIYSTHLNNGYRNMSGTSMAAPFVSGVLALYREAYPELHARDIRKMAQEDALPLTSNHNRNSQFGYGLIQPPTPPEPKGEPVVAPHTLNGKILSNEPTVGARYSLAWIHDRPNQVRSYKVYRDGKLITIVTQPAFEETLPAGKYQYTVTAIDKDGTESVKSLPYAVNVEEPPAPAPDPGDGGSASFVFKDVTLSFWAEPSITYLARFRIISGYNDGRFDPNAPVRRGQAMAMIARALDWDTDKKETSFPDVAEDYFAAGAIATAVEKGLIGGFSDGTFRPNAPITRAQMSAILGQAFALGTNLNSTFVDVTERTTGYREISRMVELGIVSGYEDGLYYRPNDRLTRAQFSVILSRVLNEEFRLQS